MSNWIKCSDRMPHVDKNCWRTAMPLIVRCEELGVIPAYFAQYLIQAGGADSMIFGFKESLRFGDNEGKKPKEDSSGLIKNVTHWMPLPAPPGE